jgi:hypothetical protein
MADESTGAGTLPAARPELLSRAAAEIVKNHPDVDADDVVLWAESRAAASA